MKNLQSPIYLTLCLCLIFTACLDERPEKQESVYKKKIQEFIAYEKLNNNEENVLKIDALEASLDFYRVDFSELSSGRELYVVDVNSTNESVKEKKKVIFIVQGNEVLTMQIIAFDNVKDSNYLNIIKDMINNKPHMYTGKISFFTIFGELIFYNVFNNGLLIVNGAALPVMEDESRSKVNGCTAWYLVVTYYYANGTTSQTSEYIGTTCDCFENSTRLGRMTCVGGEGGGGSGLPTNPQQGDYHYITLYNGVTRILEYKCSDYGCNWQIIGTTLPIVVVTSNRQEYYFLPLNPLPNMFVLGPDNLLYIYNANWMTWDGSSAISGSVPGDTEALRQFEQDYRAQMTSEELGIFDNMNRYQQVSYLLNAKIALDNAQILYPGSQHNSKADAFRHAYFSLLNVIDIGTDLAERLGTAHENWDDNPVSERFMDLYNNQKGREAYGIWQNGNLSTVHVIQGLVDSGQLVIIKNGSIVPSNY